LYRLERADVAELIFEDNGSVVDTSLSSNPVPEPAAFPRSGWSMSALPPIVLQNDSEFSATQF
jgi:hypothetical protein